MKVLITGGAGYLGSMLAPLLLRQGHNVRIMDCLMHGGSPLLGLWHEDRFEFVPGDLRSKDDIDNALDGVEAVVHLGAIVGDPACATQPDLAREINLNSSLNLLESCRRLGVGRFVFASTCSNYGAMDDSSTYVTEESELSPLSLYAETKVGVERVLLDTSANGKPGVTVLRFATLFGVSPRMRFDLTVNEFTLELLTKKKLVVYGEQFWRPYVHVKDAARAIALVLESQPEMVGSKVFNVGDTQENYQKGQLVDLICSQLGGNTEIEHVVKQEDPRDYRVSFDKIQQELGFRITRTVADGVREIIDAVKQGVISDYDNPQYRNVVVS